MTTGQLIKAAREKAGLTQAELGKKIGVTGVAIMRYEKDLRQPRLEQIQAIACALSVDPYSLYSFDQSSDALLERINARERICTALDKLNDAGMEKAAERVEELTEIPRYRLQGAPQAAPAPQMGAAAADTTHTPSGQETAPEGE